MGQRDKGTIKKGFFLGNTREAKYENKKNTPIFTTMTTGHGNLKSYLHRFKITESPTCPCGTTEYHIDHLIFQCELLGKERTS
jgi:hypothetical protein